MAATNVIKIDKTQCIGCSLCVKDCPNGHLKMRNQKACALKSGCIECGHCYAVCPQNAISMDNYEIVDEVVTPMTELDSDVLLGAMKSRRTIRYFTKQLVEKEKIDKILEAGRYCPTGANAQNVSYTILGSKQDEIEKECVKIFRRVQRAASPFVSFLKRTNITDHFFFKEAPLVIVVSGTSSTDAALASSYMEIMAESMGLGVLYSGFFVICTKVSKKIRKTLELPEGHKVSTCMVIGYPSVKYQRIVPRKQLKVKRL